MTLTPEEFSILRCTAKVLTELIIRSTSDIERQYFIDTRDRINLITTFPQKGENS